MSRIVEEKASCILYLYHFPLADEKLDMEVGMGLANKLEEMRKEGGDHWLSIWNADIMVSV